MKYLPFHCNYGRASWRLALVVFLVLVLRGEVFSDGGTVQISKKAGPFRITIFTASAIVHAGLEDASILVQDHLTHRPLLNAKVSLALRCLNKQPAVTAEIWKPPCCRMKPNLTTYQATHTAATNKLLYAATVAFPIAGKWEVQVEVLSPDTRSSVSGILYVAPPISPLLGYWPLFLFPIVTVIGYVAHCRLCSTRTQKPTHTHKQSMRSSTEGYQRMRDHTRIYLRSRLMSSFPRKSTSNIILYQENSKECAQSMCFD